LNRCTINPFRPRLCRCLCLTWWNRSTRKTSANRQELSWNDFRLFHRKRIWTLKDLNERCKQPVAWLKEVLNQNRLKKILLLSGKATENLLVELTGKETLNQLEKRLGILLIIKELNDDLSSLSHMKRSPFYKIFNNLRYAGIYHIILSIDLRDSVVLKTGRRFRWRQIPM